MSRTTWYIETQEAALGFKAWAVSEDWESSVVRREAHFELWRPTESAAHRAVARKVRRRVRRERRIEARRQTGGVYPVEP